MGTVDSDHELTVSVWRDDTCYYDLVNYVHVTSNGGAYSLDVPGPGTYYLTSYFDDAALPDFEGAGIGSPYTFYSTLCATPATAINVAGNTNVNLTFDDSCRFYGVEGNFLYTGSLGPVGACNWVSVMFYLDPSYSTLVGIYSMAFNAKDYHFPMLYLPYGTPLYARAYFDHDGNDGSCPGPFYKCITSGDPYIELGPVVADENGTLDVLLDDTQRWP